jgi:hypothetical protein
MTTDDPSRRTPTPRRARHASVEAQSAPVEKFVTRAGPPAASAASIAARCETDLSPGSEARPRSSFAGVILTGQ